jgi:hypothetical protein
MKHNKADYQRRAIEADEWANSTSDPLVRARFEKTARHWRELADRTPSGGLTMDINLPDTAGGA